MTGLWARLLGAVRLLFGGRHLAEAEGDMRDEMQFHIDMLAAKHIAAGVPAHEARRIALVEFGGRANHMEFGRDEHRSRVLEETFRDLIYAVRALRRAPAFAIAVTLSLAVGIGATSAVFTVVERVVLRPLPYGGGGALVMLWSSNQKTGERDGVISYPDYLDWVAGSHTIERSAAFNIWWPVLDGDAPEQLSGSRVGSEFFRVLGVPPLLGRTFVPGEDRPDGPHVAVISHSLWVRRFGSDPRIVGRSISLGSVPYTIIGVMPANFRDPEPLFSKPAEIWRPLGFGPTTSARLAHWLRAVARLRPGVSVDRAQHELDVIGARLARAYPVEDGGRGVTVLPMQEQVVGKARPVLFATLAAAACVLLIACANVASLVMARNETRSGELAVRTALGASRARIVRLLLLESSLLALVAGGLGLGLAAGGTTLLRVIAPRDLPRVNEIALDRLVVVVTMAVAILVTVVFGLAPAVRASRTDVSAALQGAGGRAPTDRGRVRRLAVAAELAFALVLLVATGLLARTLVRVSQVPLGFDADHLLTMQLSLVGKRYEADSARAHFYRVFSTQLAAVPGVRSVGMSSNLPVSGVNDPSGGIFGTDLTGRSTTPAGSLHYRVVTPMYRATMGIPLIRGRDLSDADTAGTQTVALVSKTAAATYFPGTNPIGHRIYIDNFGVKDVQVVGVVDDIRYDSPMSVPDPEIFVPVAQDSWGSIAIVVRTEGAPIALLPSVRRVLRALDPSLPISDPQPMTMVVGNVTGRQRFYGLLFGLFAAIALVVSAIGVYGLVAYMVARRQREIGIRIALGAVARDVLALLVGDAAMPAAIGLGVGLVGSLGATRLIAALLYGVGPRDPLTMGTAVVVLGAIVLTASLVAARSAAKITPSSALQAE